VAEYRYSRLTEGGGESHESAERVVGAGFGGADVGQGTDPGNGVVVDAGGPGREGGWLGSEQSKFTAFLSRLPCVMNF
jgi:hypothetical protein